MRGVVNSRKVLFTVKCKTTSPTLTTTTAAAARVLEQEGVGHLVIMVYYVYRRPRRLTVGRTGGGREVEQR